jgi:glutathione S-transferase
MLEGRMGALSVHHIPVCPFSQRLEILLALKKLDAKIDFHVVDITKPCDPALLAKTPGTSALPFLETEDGGVLRESLVLMQYLEDRFPEPRVAARDPFERGVENMLSSLCGDFVGAGYGHVMNQDPSKRDALEGKLLAQYALLDTLLNRYAKGDTFLWDHFGWVEAVYTPMFMRFWFVEYFENFELPNEQKYARVRRWRDACLEHPAAQQVTREEIIKLYYDYARGAGNGALLPGRQRSSFVFEPHWSKRPFPPRDKSGPIAADAELGLTPSRD